MSDTPHLEDLSLLELDDSFGPTPFQEPAEVNGIDLFKSVRDQSLENEFKLLICGVERVGQSEEDRVQT